MSLQQSISTTARLKISRLEIVFFRYGGPAGVYWQGLSCKPTGYANGPYIALARAVLRSVARTARNFDQK